MSGIARQNQHAMISSKGTQQTMHTVRLKPDVIKQRSTPPAAIWNGVQVVCHVSFVKTAAADQAA
jgi:hypothetical protein